MRTTRVFITYCTIILLLSACTPVRVSENYDTNYDFTKLKTYDWIPVGDNKNELVVKQIRRELKNQLAVKGIIHTSSNPDFLIALHGGTEDKVSIQSSNHGYHYGGWYDPRYGHYSGGTTIYKYKEGTLVLDIIDAKSKELVFQSTAIIELTQNVSMEKRQKNIKKVIEKAIRSFPPSVK